MQEEKVNAATVQALLLMSQVADIYRASVMGVRIKVAGLKLHISSFAGSDERNPTSNTILQTYQEWLGRLGKNGHYHPSPGLANDLESMANISMFILLIHFLLFYTLYCCLLRTRHTGSRPATSVTAYGSYPGFAHPLIPAPARSV